MRMDRERFARALLFIIGVLAIIVCGLIMASLIGCDADTITRGAVSRAPCLHVGDTLVVSLDSIPDTIRVCR